MTGIPHCDIESFCKYYPSYDDEQGNPCSMRHNCVRSHPAKESSDKVLEESYKAIDVKRLFLGKIAVRVRHEFTQDDDEEYYLCAEDFESVLDELTQELMDEVEELQQQQAERERMRKESDKHFGRDTHTFFTKCPICPECHSRDVLEQGYPHNHRHYCRVCNVVYWITRE